MDACTLFWVAIQSPIYGFAVVDFVCNHNPRFLNEGGNHRHDDNIFNAFSPFSIDIGRYAVCPSNASFLDKLAPELIQTILEDIPLRDLISFGRTARRYCTWAAVIFRLCVAALFRPYHIPYDLFRFVQIATGIGLSGSIIAHLVLYNRHAPDSFVPGDLDVYVPASRWEDVLTFFTSVTGYSIFKQRSSFSYGNSPSITSVIWMRAHPLDQSNLNFMRCMDDNVYGPTVQFHSTCVVGCVTSDRAWFPTLDTTSQRITILNRHNNPLRTIGDRRRALVIYRKWQARGFALEFDYSPPHTCGLHGSCPATVRTSDDAHCYVLALPCGNSGQGIFSRPPHPTDDAIAWTFGGEGCTGGGLTPYNPAYRVWKDEATSLINLPVDVEL
ncbi:hypothetical protein B0H12DRAFT_1234819 [Mycena haematopus]|nr:hypothetical protein B0H12DRAFT_1234819 [Mycena haematopus]